MCSSTLKMTPVMQLLVFSSLLSTVAMQECTRECASVFFRSVDRDKNGVTLDEVESYVDLFDENCDGGVTKDEAERKFAVLEPRLLQCLDPIFIVLDQDNDGRITKLDGVVDFLFTDFNHDFVKIEAEFVAYWNRRLVTGCRSKGHVVDKDQKSATKPEPAGNIELTIDI